jgi:hypothetical protein
MDFPQEHVVALTSKRRTKFRLSAHSASPGCHAQTAIGWRRWIAPDGGQQALLMPSHDPQPYAYLARVYFALIVSFIKPALSPFLKQLIASTCSPMLLSSAVLLAFVGYVNAADNGLALTPQMGWNTWNHFGCSISEDTVLSAAQAIKDNGLDKLGYNCAFFHQLPLFILMVEPST